METSVTTLLNPMTGKYFSWKPNRNPVFNGSHDIGVDRLHRIVRDLLLKKSYRRGSIKASSSPNTLARLFKLYDADGSGALDQDEFYQMLSDLGVQGITRQDYQELFNLYDIDGDGTISYDEWSNAYCSHFTSELGLLDLPSTRLDIKHVGMSPTEALDDLRKDIQKVVEKNKLGLLDLIGWSYFGTKNPRGLTIDEIKQTLRGQFNIGIGNEAALDLLLIKCTINDKYLSLERFSEFIYQKADKGKNKESNMLNVPKPPKRPQTARPMRSYVRPINHVSSRSPIL